MTIAVPTPNVDAISLPVDPALIEKNIATSISFIDLFLQADFIVKAVMIFLMIFSLISWAIIIKKFADISQIRKMMRRYKDDFWSGKSLETILKFTLQRSEKHPLAQVFIAAMQEIELGNSKKSYVMERLDQTMRASANESIAKLEEGVGFLATVASSAPFIGLFGTVWGIMNSFQSIAMSNNTTLAVVAPGIAEALFATAIGLIVAIPASVFHNKFANDINKISSDTENFSLELSTLIIKDL